MSHMVVYCTRCEGETSDDLTDEAGRCATCSEPGRREYRAGEKTIRFWLWLHKKAGNITSYRLRRIPAREAFEVTIWFRDIAYTDGRDERAHDTREFRALWGVDDWIKEMLGEEYVDV